MLAQSEIGIEDLRGEKFISFSRQNLSYTERYFAEKFEEHHLSKSVAWSKDDPTAARDDIIDIARSLVRAGR